MNAGCTVGGAGVFGDFTFINRSASIGDHASLKDFVSIGPGAVLAGHVTVGRVVSRCRRRGPARGCHWGKFGHSRRCGRDQAGTFELYGCRESC